jgi:hypothetical protein
VARRSVLLASLAAMAVLLLAVPAAAAESLEVLPAGCNQVTVAGSGLPASTALTVVVSDGFSGKALKQAAVTTGADGSFSVKVPVSLRGLAAVGAEARAGGRILLGATHNLDNKLRSQCGGASAGSGALPFTGPAQAYLLLAIGAGLLGVGGLMRASFAYHGRH